MGGRRFWTQFRSDVLPKVQGRRGRRGRDAAERIAGGTQGASPTRSRGADQGRRRDPQVRVLSAYKQGFLWLTEVVMPELKGKGRRESVHIKIAEHEPDLSKKFRFYEVPSRWLHELYPVDEVFERELGHRRGERSAWSSWTTGQGHLHARGDRRERPGRAPRDVQPEIGRARIPREVPRLVARRR